MPPFLMSQTPDIGFILELGHHHPHFPNSSSHYLWPRGGLSENGKPWPKAEAVCRQHEQL